MKITKKLVELVHEEAKLLKERATKTELKYLNLSTLDFDSPISCIYGQMTGDCYSERASELILSCCTTLYDWTDTSAVELQSSSISTKKVTDKTKSEFDKSEFGRNYYSPIESYICLNGADIKKLVDYLKGNTDTLDLKHTIGK